MKKIQKIDVSVGLLAGFSCFGFLINLPIWALFIGWAWYFALVATGVVFKTAIPPMLTGSLMAVLAIILIDVFAGFMPFLLGMIIAVTITVFCLMLTLKIPACSYSLVSFNAYSCMFAGYYAGFYYETGSYAGNFVTAILWITGANFLGLLFGWTSIALTNIGAKKEEKEEKEEKDV